MLALATVLVMAIIINDVDCVGSGIVVRLDQFDWLINSVFKMNMGAFCICFSLLYIEA
ncbi:hypothetical protein D1605_003945 [Xylella fastidiosa subsp. fastidiosa]|uniref:hypothetical protein n=1 Tax=Xylella fastidiosa TaxID=2371 RepID=UPI0001E35F0D|nr:hypothetical protein [Xylella fastidiosa]ADN63743.1 hypothetical protein XFLM_09265 [Xylella fastidiosa subsp. fastidiosa GB514]KAF0570844.1 hypothetical protein P305_07810 [Xylella fastidiosa subsp. fastidiosa Mus-1]MBE0261729.1 hypothetical protein [Xylella fastidiosa subsp. fastidiosa]MBE0263741.1 hypothetical protein [Xylella fastidiosa subsp. fastidiosa]MBE0270541.1 hypothetical protein [Xylella fastidiosa subsp. fastidiosa]